MPGPDNIHIAAREIISSTIKTSKEVFLKYVNEYIDIRSKESGVDPKFVKHQIILIIKNDPLVNITEFKKFWDKYRLTDDVKTTVYIQARFNKLDINYLKLVKRIADEVIDLVPQRAIESIKGALNLLIEGVSAKHKADSDEVRSRIIYIRTP